MELGGYSILGWLAFIVAMLFCAYLLFFPVYLAEILLWNLFPPPRGARYHKDNLWTLNHKILIGGILFVVATLFTMQAAYGIITPA